LPVLCGNDITNSFVHSYKIPSRVGIRGYKVKKNVYYNMQAIFCAFFNLFPLFIGLLCCFFFSFSSSSFSSSFPFFLVFWLLLDSNKPTPHKALLRKIETPLEDHPQIKATLENDPSWKRAFTRSKAFYLGNYQSEKEPSKCFHYQINLFMMLCAYHFE